DRGGRIRTGEPPGPKPGALTRLSYAPLPFERAYRMTIRAYELALLDFRSGLQSLSCLHEVADFVDLLAAGKMVPGHCDRMKEAAAVGARGRSLQPVVPRRELRSSCPDLLLTAPPVARLLRPLLLLSARLPPRLHPPPPLPPP